MMELTAQNVEMVFQLCISRGPETAKEVKGVIHTFYFDTAQVALYRDDIASMLDWLPDQFHAPSEERPQGGGGWSFLQACDRKDGVQWTGMHAVMEMLFCLGLAAGYVTELPLPRDLAPGGMPYYAVDTRAKSA